MKKCRVFSRVGFRESCILASVSSSFLGGFNISKPVLFVGQRFLQYCWDSQAEVVAFSRWQVLTTLGIELLNLGVQPTFHSKISAAVGLVFHLVAVVPLIPGQVVQLEEKTSGPALARSAEAFLIEVALLELLPMLGEKALEEVLPANGGLGSDDLVNIIILEVGKGERVVAPSVKAGEQRLLKKL